MKIKKNGKISLLIKKELSLILQRNLRDPRLKGATIGGIVLSNDFCFAKVYVSFIDINFLPNLDQNTIADCSTDMKIKLLNKASSYLRTVLANKINLRVTPSLMFYYDNAIEAINNINSIALNLNIDKDEPEEHYSK